MTSPRINAPLPRRDSASAPVGSSLAELNPRPSFDSLSHASGSRRPSAASQHSSIVSHHSQPQVHSASQHAAQSQHAATATMSPVASSNLPWVTPRETYEPNQWSHSPRSTSSQLPVQRQASLANLPRIATPANDPSQDDTSGPRSAPVSSPLTGPTLPFAHPPRSASSPDPRSPTSAGPQQDSPLTASPVEHQERPSTSQGILASSGMSASSHTAHGYSLAPDPSSAAGPHAPPPRTSSFTNAASFAAPAVPGGEGAAASTPRRSETPTSVQSSHGPTISGTPIGNSTLSASSAAATSTTKRSGSITYCAKCGLAVRGQFVRALHQVYHLDCFRCRDCDKVVAQKFFPVEDADGQYPLCERDYFARLDLICAKCDQALRSSYITACGEKFHVEHFSCSVCDTVFGAHDSYYEHDGNVYCHYHYSISFANKCVGCETAILKQFVEINRNGRDECWHPECYMIHKFWNVRLASRNFTTPAPNTPVASSLSLLEMSSMSSAHQSMSMSAMTSNQSANASPNWVHGMTADELKERQIAMELKVSQIWLVLSGFEESSAACIGEMLRVVNERQLLDVILLAEKFILHVETLFAVIDDLEAQFALAGVKGMAHAREAKQLCRKLVNFFSMLSQISPHGGQIPNMPDLLQQVTQLAHYLKILIRIALTGAIKLDREQSNPQAMVNALARLHLLSLDNADPSVRKRGDVPPPSTPIEPWTGNETPEDMAKRSFDSLTRTPEGFIPGTQRIAYGYRSLAFESTGETTLRGPQDDRFVPHDGCTACNGTIEDDCIRLGMFNRWHSLCVACQTCHDTAGTSKEPESPVTSTRAPHDDESHEGGSTLHEVVTKLPHRRPPPRVNDFTFEPPQTQYAPADTIWCNLHRTASSVPGFQSVSRLEQFAFLLHVALRRLYLHFREHHQIPSALSREPGQDVKRVKSVTLDRKLSSTARLPQRSTVVESPAGKMADANGHVVSAARDDGPSIPTIVPPPGEEETAKSVDVIRPPFARNNTSIRIVSENSDTPTSEPQAASGGADMLAPFIHPGRKVTEDDAITLSDISMLANQSVHMRPGQEGVPLFAQLKPHEQVIIRHFALISLQKTGLGHLVDVEEVLELLDTRKNQWWNKLFKNNAKKDQKRKGIFGVPLEMLVDRTGSDSQQGVGSVLLRVPEFIEEMISTMRQQDMAIEGIFRKNGNIRRLQTISDALDKDYGSVTLSEENPVQLAALLKRFLRELPDPLLTFRLHKLWCAAATLPNPADRKRCLHLLSVLLPKANRDTMEVLFVFLRWVASFSYRDEETGSRMDLANLATVITPSILYGKGANAARDESFVAIQAVQQLLEGQDDIYRVPADLQFVLHEKVASIFSREIDLPPKEIHKHCIKYLQARGAPGSRLGQGLGPPSAIRERPPVDLRAPGGPYRDDRQPSISGYRDDRQGSVSAYPVDRQGSVSVYRDDRQASVSVGGTDSQNTLNPPPNTMRGGDATLRAAAASPRNDSRPTSWGGAAQPPGAQPTGPVVNTGVPSNLAGGISGGATPTAASTNAGTSRRPPGTLVMPTPQINGNQPSSVGFPQPHGPLTPTGHPMPSPGWRGPFHPPPSNGSRQSSRGSAPPSPGIPEQDRPSLQLERDRSRERTWTPVDAGAER